ncbi:asparagine--tRNA ligase, partial [candidate division WOR-3 bacterium]|nr:asparagine--tRNA ligase [candidate division WOR-3 bacterium]
PEEIMAFYKPSDPNDPGKALCFDLLATDGYGEIIGGSERETNIEVLKEKLIRDGEDPANYEWYMDLRRYGSVPHSGFGMGVERAVRWILRLDHIKDAIGFPRLRNRIYP